LAGGFATDVRVSEWLLAFSMFFFLSLACVKRFSELYVLRQSNKQQAKGRGYVADDLEQIAQFGSASGYLSVLVLALYVSSKEVVALYGSPRVLWLMCPLLLYWISRVWLIAHRGKLHDDPIVFALQDRTSYVVGLSAALLLMLAL
jgi:4-hydroxybenzoate polyprenyltransferase